MPELETRNTTLYYESTGQGQPLVFIHGLGSSTRDWEFQVSEFSKAYQVITFDLRGHGKSAKPPGAYSIPMFAFDTADLVHALGVGAAHIVGISLGGAVAFQFALDHPELTKTLTIVNSAPTMGDPAQAEQEIERRVGIVQQYGMRAMGQNLGRALFPEPQEQALRQTFVERWAENDPDAYIRATRAMLHWNVVNQLGALTCPTLIIAANQDYSPVAVKVAYAKLIPDARVVVIPEARHAVPLEHPSKFNPVLAEFLAVHIIP